jgi:hypothetical protein
MKKFAFLLFTFFIASHSKAQNPDINERSLPVVTKSLFSPANQRNYTREGNFFTYWGYNFSWYNKSDIHFKGPGYNFTLKDVLAYNRPSKLNLDYLNPGVITVPQFNFHVGYFISDNYSVSIGWDHMKYVMEVPQTLKIDGYIDSQVSNPGIPTGKYAGVYDNQSLTVDEDMLTFEHTDGFNYASVEVQRHDDIYVSHSGKSNLTMETGLGAGLMVPRSDVRLFGVGQNNYWNIAGYGVSVKAGLKYYFTRRFYLQNSLKTGWTNLTKIRTTGRDEYDTASQHISYLENYTVLGYQF